LSDLDFSLTMQDLETLLVPFLSKPLSLDQLDKLGTYLDLLIRWNAKISLTSIRDPEDIVSRHFGESLFAGQQLGLEHSETLADLGSGAGFPGLPMALLHSSIRVTLIESQQKKVAFLREVIRALALANASVYAGRAEDSALKSQIVTMRAVETFQSSLPIAASLLAPGGKLALLIGISQAEVAKREFSKLEWQQPIPIPQSRSRVLLIGQN
jgi:16S rRNA (guanine527-N7)-methyltransferase